MRPRPEPLDLPVGRLGGDLESELVALEELSVTLATVAGRFVRDERPALLGVSHTKTTELDVVTEMDTRCETLLRAELARQRPDDAVLGEEEGLTAGVSGLTWVLDPIDGTVNYLYDYPAYAVSVAVVVGDPTTPGSWSPVAGAVHNPAVDEVFHARAGGGARVDRPVRPGASAYTSGRALGPLGSTVDGGHPTLSRALVGTGFSYDLDARRTQGAVAAEVLTRIRDLRRSGSAALDLCHVGAGRLDGYYERGLHPWDMAAGALVVTEAGGVVSGLDAVPSERMVLAASPGLHGDLHEMLSRLHG